MSNDTTRLFGLSGVEVVGVEVADDDIPMLSGVRGALRAAALLGARVHGICRWPGGAPA